MDLVLLHEHSCARGSIPCARPVSVGRDKGRELPLGLLSHPARAAVSGTDCLGVSRARFSSARSPCCCRPRGLEPRCVPTQPLSDSD